MPDITYNTLYRLILQKRVIPIIGFDLYDAAFKAEMRKILETEVGGNSIVNDALSFLALTYNPELYNKIVNAKSETKTGFQIINAMYHSLPTNERETFGSAISAKIIEFKSLANPIPNCIAQLAMIKPFRFYINATFFNSLELAVSKFRVPKSEVDENSNYDVVSYDKMDLKDIPYDNTKSGFSTEYFKKPLIYNWLGTHDKSNGEFVLADVDYIELLVKMITNENNGFLNLKAALKNAYLLFIGCDFPDWILRFFLRFCIDDRMDSKEALGRNYLIERIDDEPSKAFLIGSTGITKYQEPPDKFISKMYANLKELDKNCIETSFSNNKVFISYNHEDTEIAKKINKHLKDQFIDTWFDERLETGDSLSDEITSAIDNSCAFIGIVTGNVDNHVNQAKYFKDEWNYVVDNYNSKSKNPKKIYRIVTDDFQNRKMEDNYLKPLTREYFLGNRDTFSEAENVKAPDFVLSENFIKRLQDLQYKIGLLGI